MEEGWSNIVVQFLPVERVLLIFAGEGLLGSRVGWEGVREDMYLILSVVVDVSTLLSTSSACGLC